MAKEKKGKKIVKILLILAIIWFIFDNFDLGLMFKERIESGIGFKKISSMNDDNVRQLNVKLISFDKSFNSGDTYFDVKNMDNVSGDVTVYLNCTGSKETYTLTENILPGKTKTFKFYELKGVCDDYKIEPEIVE